MQAQEGAQADQECGDSSVLLEGTEQAAHTRNDTSGGNRWLPSPDATEQYCGSQLPIEQPDEAGVSQDQSFAAVVVVRETRNFPTSARPWHGLSQPARASAVCEKPCLRKATTCWYRARRSSRFAWLSCASFGLNFGGCTGCAVERGVALDS